MLNKIWPFLKAEENQNLLGFLQGSIIQTQGAALSFGHVPGERAGLGGADPGRNLRQPLGYPSAACEHGINDEHLGAAS